MKLSRRMLRKLIIENSFDDLDFDVVSKVLAPTISVVIADVSKDDRLSTLLQKHISANVLGQIVDVEMENSKIVAVLLETDEVQQSIRELLTSIVNECVSDAHYMYKYED